MTPQNAPGLQWKSPALLAVLGGALAACFVAFPRDDAFITFRYAERIAAGLGFTYQDGNSAIGTSTPLWTLALAGLARVGLPVGPGAACLGVLLHALAIGILARILQDHIGNRSAWAGAALLAVNPPSAAIAASGMETALVELLVVLGLGTVLNRRAHLGAVVSALLVLTRVDLLPLALLLLWAHGHKSGRRLLPNLLLFMLVTAPWFLFSWHATGSLLPHSIDAKLAYYAGRGWSNGDVAMTWAINDPVRAGLCALAIIGAFRLRRRPVAILALWPPIHLIALARSGTWIHEWYLVPPYPIVFFFAAVAIAAAFERPRVPRWAFAVFVTALISAGAHRVQGAHRAWDDATDLLLQCHGAIADFLSERAETGETIACGDIGIIGYRTGAPILDTVGLVSPAAVPHIQADDPAAIYRELEPAWAVIANYGPDHERVLSDPSFLAKYEEVFQRPHGPGRTYRVFARSHP